MSNLDGNVETGSYWSVASNHWIHEAITADCPLVKQLEFVINWYSDSFNHGQSHPSKAVSQIKLIWWRYLVSFHCGSCGFIYLSSLQSSQFKQRHHKKKRPSTLPCKMLTGQFFNIVFTSHNMQNPSTFIVFYISYSTNHIVHVWCVLDIRINPQKF